MISELRSHDFDIVFYKNKISFALESSILVYESIYPLLLTLKVDLLYVFNGRFFDVWPAIKASQKLGITFYTLEMWVSFGAEFFSGTVWLLLFVLSFRNKKIGNEHGK